MLIVFDVRRARYARGLPTGSQCYRGLVFVCLARYARRLPTGSLCPCVDIPGRGCFSLVWCAPFGRAPPTGSKCACNLEFVCALRVRLCYALPFGRALAPCGALASSGLCPCGSSRVLGGSVAPVRGVAPVGGLCPPPAAPPCPPWRVAPLARARFGARPPCPLARFAPRARCALARAFRPLAVGGGRAARPLPRVAVLGAIREGARALAPPARPSSGGRALRVRPCGSARLASAACALWARLRPLSGSSLRPARQTPTHTPRPPRAPRGGAYDLPSVLPAMPPPTPPTPSRTPRG